ncbi:zinc ribbon domain-containing protein [Viridibacillus sp. YIM B01967]|uniref:Zinc ribbon domain-containing protein n=1 Tax=Viridibacillus soli TaxID=2798301 RepID=A0ABS1H6I5_9BACL|nr:zinc ribbon domain-containing protein [Viridibacillus soli]MBK3495016.1 zinc ribbon domain-containing protein [Viridibacillus soli]
MTNVLTQQEMKDLSNSLQQKKSQRATQIIHMGEEAYRLLRFQQLKSTELEKLASQILETDKTIYETNKKLYRAKMNSSECPSCHSSLSQDAKFCGSCGQPNPHYKIDEVEEVECTYCHAYIEKGTQYCPCCGSQIGGTTDNEL